MSGTYDNFDDFPGVAVTTSSSGLAEVQEYSVFPCKETSCDGIVEGELID